MSRPNPRRRVYARGAECLVGRCRHQRRWRDYLWRGAAFIAAANRSVTDARARLDAVTVPPALFPLTAIVTLAPQRRSFVLVGVEAFGHVVIERADGVRLLDVHNAGSVPSAGCCCPRVKISSSSSNNNNKPSCAVRARQRCRCRRCRLHHPIRRKAATSPGFLDRGLFAEALSAAYYQGHVDSMALPAVTMTKMPTAATTTTAAPAALWTPVTTSFAAVSLAAGVGAVVAGAVATVAFVEASTTTLERPAHDAQTRYGIALAVAGGAFAVAIGSAIGFGVVAVTSDSDAAGERCG